MEPEERPNDDKDRIRLLERLLAVEHTIRCQAEKKVEQLEAMLASQKPTE